MNKVIVGLRYVKRNQLLECRFDTRLSFKDNLNLVEKMSGYKMNDYELYDPTKNFFLDANKTPGDYGCQGYTLVHIFELGEHAKMKR